MYLLLGAEFVAAVQVIVYAGAIMVLFVFIIMLLNAGKEERTKGSRVAILLGVPGVAIGAVLVAWTIRIARTRRRWPSAHCRALRQAIARLLFHDFLLPFEVTSILILIAIMGAVVLASRPEAIARPHPTTPATRGTSRTCRAKTRKGALMVPLSYYLILSGILFACGVLGFLIKRNIITIFMSIELMLNGVNLSFVAFAAHWHALSGQVFVFFVMVVAAAEAAVGLAIIIAVYRTRETLNVDQVNLLKL